MKKLLVLILNFSFLIIHSASAQAPSGFTYQSVLRDANNDLIINTTVGTRISILQGSSSGTAVFVETHSQSTNANGLLTLQVGSGSVVSGTFGSIDWGNGPYFIKAETDPSGGTTYTISGTQQMMSVPYALYATTSGGSSPSSQDTLSIIADADGNTRIQVEESSNEDKIRFGTFGAERMIIDNAGNVGVGTSAPSDKLHVEGSIRMVDGNQQAGYIPISDANGKMTWADPTTIATANDGDWTISGSDQYSAVSGNVGIGTTAPGVKLDVVGEQFNLRQTANYTGVMMNLRGNRHNGVSGNPWNHATTGYATINFKNSDATDGNVEYIGARITSVNEGASDDGDLRFYTTNDLTEAEAMRISYDGNVGIGTVGAERLHVEGSIRMVDGNQATGFIPVSDANGTMVWTDPGALQADTLSIIADADGNTKIQVEESSNEDKIRFDTFGAERMVIDNAGNVGIGTASPSKKLHVLGDSKLQGDLSVLGNASLSNNNLSFTDPQNSNAVLIVSGNDAVGGSTGLYVRPVASPSGVSVFSVLNQSSQAMLQVKDNGNVGIGTTTPTQGKLVVNGTGSSGSYSYGYLNSSGSTGTAGPNTVDYSIWASSRIRAAEFNAMSDARAKIIVKRSEKAELLALVNELQVTEYAYIDSLEHGTRSKQGFIAQEIEQVYPNAISKNTDYVPSVFARSTNISYNAETQLAAITVEKPHALAVGDKLKLMTNDETLEVTVEEVADANTFTVKMETAEDAVFVYGKQVDDFRAVDYDQLFSIGIGAIQELSDKVEALETENAALKAELHTEKTSNEARLLRIEQVLQLDAKAQR
ncbi:MAG: tail fiber domain-containing protein [Flavobacteriales bacterium]|nr:tail fiber domain-containing protein [Flavobacteriales bacterium]